jgi:hypothetical protein
LGSATFFSPLRVAAQPSPSDGSRHSLNFQNPAAGLGLI